MITKEVNKFMALAPLMLPRLIDSKKCAEPDITEDSAILYFSLEEKFPIGCVMDMLDDDMDLLLLYHGTSKTAPNTHHCCFFASPKLGQSMYKVNMVSQPNGFIDGISVTIYDSIDVWEDELESDLISHEASFDFIEAMTAAKLLSVFCKMNYDG